MIRWVFDVELPAFSFTFTETVSVRGRLAFRVAFWGPQERQAANRTKFDRLADLTAFREEGVWTRPWQDVEASLGASDLAHVDIAEIEEPPPPEPLVCDGDPSTMTDYFMTIANFFGLTPPPQISMAEAQTRLSPEMLSYLLESRRLDNTRMIERLGVELLYPELKIGLQAILDETSDYVIDS